MLTKAVLFLDYVELTGFIKEVGKVQVSRSGNKYFVFYIHHESGRTRTVCFDAQRQPYFTSLSEEKTPYRLEHLTRSHSDLLVNQKTVITKTTVTFSEPIFKEEITTLFDVVNKSQLYDRVTIVGRIFNLSKVENPMGGSLWQDNIIDDSNITREITFFDAEHMLLQEGDCYKISDVIVGDYKSVRVIKVASDSKVSKLENNAVTALPISLQQMDYEGMISSVSLSSICKRYFCKTCNTEVVVKGKVATCESCCVGMILDEVRVESDINFNLTTTKNKVELYCSTEKLEIVFPGCTENTKNVSEMLVGAKVKVKVLCRNEKATVQDIEKL